MAPRQPNLPFHPLESSPDASGTAVSPAGHTEQGENRHDVQNNHTGADPGRAGIYETLRAGKMLLTALDSYASELRDRHLAWMERLNEVKPGRDPAQLSSEALELAILGLEDHLRSASPKDATASTAPAVTTTRPSEASPLA